MQTQANDNCIGIPYSFLRDCIALCDGVVRERKDEWGSMELEEKQAWVTEFVMNHAHPINGECETSEQEARVKMVDDFREAVKPLHEWLCKYGHPHMRVNVEQDGAHVYEGQFGISLPVPD